MHPKNRGIRPDSTPWRCLDCYLGPKVFPRLHVASATDTSLFRFGIASFVKVCLMDQVAPRRLDTDVLPSVLSDELFICDSCDMKGVPDLKRGSRRHTEEHHLIRCLAPEEAEEEAPSSPDQQLRSLERRFGVMQQQYNELSGRIGNMEQILHRLASCIG